MAAGCRAGNPLPEVHGTLSTSDCPNLRRGLQVWGEDAAMGTGAE